MFRGLICGLLVGIFVAPKMNNFRQQLKELVSYLKHTYEEVSKEVEDQHDLTQVVSNKNDGSTKTKKSHTSGKVSSDGKKGLDKKAAEKLATKLSAKPSAAHEEQELDQLKKKAS